MGVYLALDPHTNVCSAQGSVSTTYGTFISQSVWKLLAKKRSVLLCGNKMPTRCNRLYLLQILLHAQHVSGNTMPML